MSSWRVVLFALIHVHVVVCSFASADEASATDDGNSSKSTCTIYLAESTIPNAGFGVYTTEAVKKDDVILKADSPSIIITDIDEYQPNNEKPNWQHANYVWTAYGQGSFEAHATSESILTFGSLPNFHPALKSAGPSGIERYDDTMFNRFKDPGAGATSYFMGHDFVAKYRDIEANEEIFVDYGMSWLDGRDYFDKVPRAQEYKDAEAVIGMLSQALQEGTSAAADPILQLARGILEMYSDRTLSLMPNTIAELEGLDLSSKNFLAHSKRERRSEEWIRTNGKCLDNILPGRSTLSQAGMGGFAKRMIRKGDDVVPVPVLLISDSGILNMEGDDIDENLFKRITKYFGRSHVNTRRKQLLLNYCFGHGESKMLFCPQSNAVLVNHCSARSQWGGQCGESGPNAALRWATDWDKATAATLRLGLEEVSKQSSRGLTLELYALRDILPGEEIFIDYGEDWEKAWLDHVENWQPPKPSSEFFSYQGVTEINSRREENIRTVSEKKSNPLPPNIMTGCLYWEPDEDEADWGWFESIDEDDIEDWKSLDDDGTILELFGRSGADYNSTHKNEDFAEYWPCAVYTKDESNQTAVVQIFQSPSTEETEWAYLGIPRFLTDYPLESIMFFHGPYKSDQHLPNAFRHHIGLRDELVPDQWKETAAGDASSVCVDSNEDPETCSISTQE